MIEAIAFYTFAGVLLISTFGVISARNPVHSVLFLILSFFNASALFVLLGAEFIAMILTIVYVGAVAVLFLFVVMMLDVDFAALKAKARSYLSIGGLVGFVLLVEIYLIVKSISGVEPFNPNVASPTPDVEKVSNTHALGQIIYTDYVFLFQMAGMVLFLAMIGAIVLTHRTRPGVRRQVIEKQVHRTKEETIEIAQVEKGAGVQ